MKKQLTELQDWDFQMSTMNMAKDRSLKTCILNSLGRQCQGNKWLKEAIEITSRKCISLKDPLIRDMNNDLNDPL